MERAHQYWNSAIFHRRGLQNESPVYYKRFIWVRSRQPVQELLDGVTGIQYIRVCE